jgi:hypothetical protein
MKPHVRDMNGELHLELPIAVQAPPAPPAQAAIATLDDIRRAANASLRWENHYIVSTRESWWWKRYGPAANPEKPDDYANWNKSIAGGKSYLVGEAISTETFLKTHRSSCRLWQQNVFGYCKAHPHETVNLRNRRFNYDCYWRGEYCVISLPHHDAGGERSWITRDGKSKTLVNVD